MANTEKIVVQVVVKGEKDLQRVGKSADKSTKSFGKMAAGVAAAAASFATINKVIGTAIRSFRDFEFQMAKVKAITGASNIDFKKLSNTAQQLGRSTFFTAQQVAELQTNYGKLGFTTQEILDAQEATLMLATATDSDLARAAIVAGSAVRGFGLDASETQRVVDVMAVAFTSSALDIEKFQTSMTKVAPIAKSAGFSIEDTTSIMSQLADSGIEASIAGTSLRNILLKMQDPNSDLVKSFGKTIHSLDELVPALSKFSEEGGSLAEIMEVVDLRQAAAFEQMITSRERTVQLRDALKDASGAAEEMANIVGDTLEGSFKRFTSATEGLQIALMGEKGGILANFIDNLAKFANAITDSIAPQQTNLQLLQETTQEMDDQFTLLTQGNLSQEARVQVIQDLNNEYGDYLPNLVSEKDDLEDIRDMQVEVNNLMMERIVAMAMEEELAELAKAQSKAIKGQVNSNISLAESKRDLLTADENNSQALQMNIALTEAFGEVNKDIVDNIEEDKEKLIAGYEETAKQLGLSFKNIMDALNTTKEAKKEADKESTAATVDDTNATVENTKAKELNNDVDKEMLDFRVTQMMMGYLKEEEIAQLQADLKKREIQDLRNLLKVQGDIGIDRMAIAQRIFDLETDLNKQSKEDKDKAFAEDVKRAALSGESASDAAKRLIRAKIMEAVSLYIVGAFAANPLVGAIVAAGAGSLVSGVFENAFSNITFANGGMIEEFANGGMVHGRSHAQGGEKFAVGGRVVELEGGEAVINKRSTAMFGKQLSAMNAAGGGVKFADGGLLNMPSFSQQQFNAIGQNQMMGAMGSSSKVVVVEADITDSQNLVSVIQSEATI